MVDLVHCFQEYKSIMVEVSFDLAGTHRFTDRAGARSPNESFCSIVKVLKYLDLNSVNHLNSFRFGRGDDLIEHPFR